MVHITGYVPYWEYCALCLELSWQIKLTTKSYPHLFYKSLTNFATVKEECRHPKDSQGQSLWPRRGWYSLWSGCHYNGMHSVRPKTRSIGSICDCSWRPVSRRRERMLMLSKQPSVFPRLLFSNSCAGTDILIFRCVLI